MNFTNAVGFVVFGIISLLLPTIAPAWFDHVAVDGASTRALWVQFMGVLQCGIGLGYALRYVAVGVMQLRARAADTIAVPETAIRWEPVPVRSNVVAVDFGELAAAREREAA